MLKNFQEIAVETPVDKIIKQIRSLITSGQLNSGDKLPSERKLAERLGVGRTHVRDAIAKLDFLWNFKNYASKWDGSGRYRYGGT